MCGVYRHAGCQEGFKHAVPPQRTIDLFRLKNVPEDVDWPIERDKDGQLPPFKERINVSFRISYSLKRAKVDSYRSRFAFTVRIVPITSVRVLIVLQDQTLPARRLRLIHRYLNASAPSLASFDQT